VEVSQQQIKDLLEVRRGNSPSAGDSVQHAAGDSVQHAAGGGGQLAE
jgi:hypothetical protein